MDEDVKAQQPPSHCRQVENHSFPVFLSLIFCILLFCLVFRVIYQHNYGAIVLGREGCREVQG